MTLVVDASAFLEYLLGTDRSSAIGMHIRAPRASLDAPALCDVEVVSGLRAALLRRELSRRRAGEALRDYEDIPLRRHGHRRLLHRVFEVRNNFSAYDATYVALAERLDAQLLTADDSLARSVRAHTSVPVVELDAGR